MKANPGNGLLRLTLLLLLSLCIHAADAPARFEFVADKPRAYVKEPVVLTFTAEQTDRTRVMFFFVRPKKSDAYDIHLLTKSLKDKGRHHSFAVFKFVLFPLKAGTLEVPVRFRVKTATDEGVAQAYVEDHDDSKGIELDSTDIPVAPLKLEIQPLPKPVDLVGDFTLDARIDRRKIVRYDTVNLHYTLAGTGYDDRIALLHDLPGVSVFSDVQDRERKLTGKGYRIVREYTYALSAKENFTVPALSLRVFSPSRRRFYTLKTPSYAVEVAPLDTQKLLDDTEAPKPESTVSVQTAVRILSYLLVFVFGFSAGRFMPDLSSYFRRKRAPYADIASAKNAKQLLEVLLRSYRDVDGMSEHVRKLERMVYEKRPEKFAALKKEILYSVKNSS